MSNSVAELRIRKCTIFRGANLLGCKEVSVSDDIHLHCPRATRFVGRRT